MKVATPEWVSESATEYGGFNLVSIRTTAYLD